VQQVRLVTVLLSPSLREVDRGPAIAFLLLLWLLPSAGSAAHCPNWLAQTPQVPGAFRLLWAATFPLGLRRSPEMVMSARIPLPIFAACKACKVRSHAQANDHLS